MIDPADNLPRRPKTSIFDLTLPGTPAPRRKLFGSQVSPEEPAPEPAMEPRLYHAPRTAVADASEPPVPPALLEQQLQEALGEATVEAPEDLFEITDPGALPQREAPVPLPTQPMDSRATVAIQVPLSPAEPFDEGTAAEWNPRWSSTPGIVAPLPVPAHAPVAPGIAPAHAFPLGKVLSWAGAAAILVIAAWIFLPMLQQPGTPRSAAAVPEGLRPYVVRAEAGDLAAMRLLGLRYAYGVDAPLDRVQGVRWLARAARAGSPAAAQELQALGMTLSPTGTR